MRAEYTATFASQQHATENRGNPPQLARRPIRRGALSALGVAKLPDVCDMLSTGGAQQRATWSASRRSARTTFGGDA